MCRIHYINIRALTCDQLRDEMKKLFREIGLNKKLVRQEVDPYRRGKYIGLIHATYDHIHLLREVYWHQALREKKLKKS